jgi:hypothetical protein
MSRNAEAGVQRCYVVGVRCYYKTAGNLQSDTANEIDDVPEWVEAIRKALDVPTPTISGLPSGCTVWNVEVENLGISQQDVSPGNLCSCALVGFMVYTSELRN